MRLVASRILSLSLVATLAACSGGGGSSGASNATSNPVSIPAVPSSPVTLGAVKYGAETTVGAQLQGPASTTTSNVAFGVMVKMQNASGLFSYAASVDQPSSGNYRQWLTPQDIASRYGASQSDYTKVATYFASKGLSVASWQQRELLFVSGPIAAAQTALGAQFGTYTKNGVTFTALTTAPTALAGLPIVSLPGVSTYAAAKQARQFVKVSSGAPSFGAGYSPSQVASAFDYSGAYNAGYTGKGVTIGIIGTGPISQADYTTYRAAYGLRGSSTVTQVTATDAGTAAIPAQYVSEYPPLTLSAPPATTAQCSTSTEPNAACNPEDFEAQIDTEQTFGLAPDSSVLFYLAYAKNVKGYGNLEGIELTPFELQQAINDNTADILSLSYGEGELDDVGGDFNLASGSNTVDFTSSPGPMQFASLAAEGIAVFVSSGDSGNTECARDGVSSTASDECVSYPSIDPNVVGVGGVNSPIGLNGQLSGPLTSWGSQTGGNDPALGASGGGVSAYFPQPTFQAAAVNVTGSTRNSPDVSLVADPFTGVATLFDAGFNDGGFEAFGGTSVAAPQTAAMWALVLQACSANPATCKGTGSGAHAYRLGDPNPLFYKAYANATTYGSTFYDVVFGDNSQLPCSPLEGNCPSAAPQPTPVPGYVAGTGYDRVTGLGVPFGRALIKTVVGI